MPGKHAPKSPWSFYLSIGRAAGGVAGALVLVVILAVVAFGGRGDDNVPEASGSATPRASQSPGSPASVSPTPSPSPTVKAPSEVVLTVLNGNGRPGLAKSTAAKIEAGGYQVKSFGNTGVPAQVSTVYYQDGFEQEALAFQAAFPSFTDVKPASEAPSDVKVETMLVGVIGKDWPKGT